MRVCSMESLCSERLELEIIDVFPELWLTQREFLLYKSRPRPCSALFFVCAELRITFYDADGAPIVEAGKGDVIFIPRQSRYFVRALGTTSTKIGTYTVNLQLADASGEELTFSERIARLAHLQDNLAELRLKGLCDAFHATPRNLARTHGEFYLLLDLIASPSRQNDEFFYPIRRGVEAFYDEWNKNEKIEKYAQMSGVSETYFYRCFRRWSGKSPIEYRNLIRLSNAESLLRCTDMKIREIATTVGFEDPFYFCRIFAATYGCSPRRWRTESREGAV